MFQYLHTRRSEKCEQKIHPNFLSFRIKNFSARRKLFTPEHKNILSRELLKNMFYVTEKYNLFRTMNFLANGAKFID
jgi:hypothetical protein